MEAETTYNKTTDQLTLKELMVLMVSDIDIFLLKEGNQIDDKKNSFSVEEVRNQLKSTLSKFVQLYQDDMLNILDTPIYKAFKVYKITCSPCSEKEKKDMIENLMRF